MNIKELIFISMTLGNEQSLLLNKPENINQSAININSLSKNLDMKWFTNQKLYNLSLAFKHKDKETIITIELTGDFPQELEKHKNKFSLIEDKKWIFTTNNNKKEHITRDITFEDAMGIIHTPREIENCNPKNLNIDDATNLIKHKKCVFYTGAGISAGVVPTMKELMNNIGISKNFLSTISKAMDNPENTISVMDKFYNACLFGQPTDAHIATKAILLQKNWGLITENLDLLHQRSGITPLSHNGKDWIRGNVGINDLKQIDYIITIGLAKDESGFLGWYKHHNPSGKIIAINLTKPIYLDDQDYLVQGDIQKLIPHMKQCLNTKH